MYENVYENRPEGGGAKSGHVHLMYGKLNISGYTQLAFVYLYAFIRSNLHLTSERNLAYRKFARFKLALVNLIYKLECIKKLL